MPDHKFKIGEHVRFVSRSVTGTTKEGYEVVRLLPPSRTDVQYRIKNLRTGQERVVIESEIS